MHPRRFVLLVLSIWWLAVRPSCAEPKLAEAFGFPATTDGPLDIRIWLGGGIVVPETVYRLYEDTAGRVHGQVIVWLRLHDESVQAGKPTNRQLRKLMRTYCDSPRTAGQLTWCEELVDKDSLRVTLKDLQPDALWSLSDSFPRDCGWAMEDGETVTLDLVRGRESHHLSIPNPDFCCSESLCVFASHARDVVEHNLHPRWSSPTTR